MNITEEQMDSYIGMYNRAKGDLTTEEYMRLLSFLHELGPVAEKSVLSRLKASGYAYYRR